VVAEQRPQVGRLQGQLAEKAEAGLAELPGAELVLGWIYFLCLHLIRLSCNFHI
jgi:hypothetical protein